MSKNKNSLVLENRQARFNYAIEERFEAGLVLEGWEVKAIKAGQANFGGGSSYVRVVNGEAFLESLSITALPQADKGLLVACPAYRPRKLLLRKVELGKLQRKVAERGYTVVPLAIHDKGKLKLEIALARGKTHGDKRATIKDRDDQRRLAVEPA